MARFELKLDGLSVNLESGLFNLAKLLCGKIRSFMLKFVKPFCIRMVGMRKK
jgi:hypothetical protein